MTTKAIMSTDVAVLKPDDTVATALQMMRDRQVHNLPVLDDDGYFIGLFSLRRFSRELLPKAAKLDEHSLQMHINFMPDSADQLHQRLIKLGKQPVSELLEKQSKLRFCKPETPLPELLVLLSENPTSLPVVVIEGEKKKLAGMVSNWDVLARLAVNLLTSSNMPADSSPSD